MNHTKEFKDSVLKRLNQNETVTSLSDELNISKSTIYQWVRTHNKKQKNNSINLKFKSNWTSEDKFRVVLESSSFTEAELADEGRYIASESTIYKIKEEKMNTHRGKTSPPVKKETPTHIATAPNQVLTWDITWLNAFIKGQYYKLYLNNRHVQQTNSCL